MFKREDMSISQADCCGVCKFLRDGEFSSKCSLINKGEDDTVKKTEICHHYEYDGNL